MLKSIIVTCINPMLLFYFTFLFGYSAYASQFLICVTMKEEKSKQNVL